jgi:hypothetical protein
MKLVPAISCLWMALLVNTIAFAQADDECAPREVALKKAKDAIKAIAKPDLSSCGEMKGNEKSQCEQAARDKAAQAAEDAKDKIDNAAFAFDCCKHPDKQGCTVDQMRAHSISVMNMDQTNIGGAFEMEISVKGQRPFNLVQPTVLIVRGLPISHRARLRTQGVRVGYAYLKVARGRYRLLGKVDLHQKDPELRALFKIESTSNIISTDTTAYLKELF